MEKNLRVLVLFFCCMGIHLTSPAQPAGTAGESVKISKAVGTGRTTGHIADITVTNKGKTPVVINPQTMYIPSDGKYQPYVGTIPGTTIPPGGTVVIPVDGYCADVYTPPVGSGQNMPPVDDWIPVGDPGQVFPPGTVNIVPGAARPYFHPEDIPGIASGPGYIAKPFDTGEDIITTWPGTDTPVGGVIDPVNHPEIFGPVIVTVLDKIKDAVPEVLADGVHTTPFAGTASERPSVIQQTFWIYMAGVTGRPYTKDVFEGKVYDQFESSAGKTVATIPVEDKEKLDAGVDQFWSVFTAVGVEAKVLSPTQVQQEETPPAPSGPFARAADTDCLCDSLTFRLVVRRENSKDNTRSKVISSGDAREVLKTDARTKEIETGDWKEGDYYVISILDAEMKCHCQNSGGTSPDCDFYAASVVPKDLDKVQLEDDPETEQGEAENLKDIKKGGKIEPASKKDSDFKYKFIPKHKKGEENVSITFCLSSVCSSKECNLKNNKAKCGPYCITLDFKKT